MCIRDSLDTLKVDILLRTQIAPITITILFRRLYCQKRYSEILELRSLLSSSCIFSHITSLANAYAHFCQALGECGYSTEMIFHANYACYSFQLYEENANVALLCGYIKEDFEIDVLY